MNIVEFLQDLSGQGIELRAEEGRLRYRAPKEFLTPDLLEKIKQHKSEILQLLSEQDIETTDGKEEHPLSHGQRALWFLYQLAPESAAYNLMYAAQLQPDVDIQVLQTAFESLFKRHLVLRTTYNTHNDEPVAQIHPDRQFHIQAIDASQWSQEQLDSWMAQEADRPFDLEQGAVLRVNVVTGFSERNGEEAQGPILLLVAHHIAVDFWSLEVLVDELCELYQAIKLDKQANLPPLSWQYKDYVRWEAKHLASPEGEKLWDYWQNQLSGELPMLNLPTDWTQTYF